MAVFTISATVNEQDISLDFNGSKLVSGSKDIYQIQFTFSESWDSYTKKVVFENPTPKRAVIEILLSDTNICTIPIRSLANPTFLRVGVYGVGTNDEVMPTVWSDKFPIHEGTYQGYENPAAPDPDVYDEILAALATKQEAATAATKAMIGINEYNTWRNGGYNTTVGGTVNLDQPSSASTKKCLYAPINEGEFVYFNVSSGSASYRAFGFVDKDYKVIARAGANGFTGDRVQTAPKGTKYVIINTNRSSTTSWVRVGSFEELIARWTGQFGNIGMFTSIGVIGTSWDAGYFYSEISGSTSPYTRSNKAWIKILGNMYGIPAYNFGVTSGTTCLPDSPWVGTDGAVSWQGNTNGLPALQASDMERPLVFMDLVQNDAKKLGENYLGSIADVKDDYTQNPDTFYGNYARIIEQVKAKYSEEAIPPKFIFCYKKADGLTAMENTYADAVVELAEHFGVPSLNWFDDPWFAGWIYSHLVESHPTAADYATMAKAADRLFSECMRKNWNYFKNYIPKAE